jgi:hypothetical protein
MRGCSFFRLLSFFKFSQTKKGERQAFPFFVFNPVAITAKGLSTSRSKLGQTIP